jgi:hypothetical protein
VCDVSLFTRRQKLGIDLDSQGMAIPYPLYALPYSFFLLQSSSSSPSGVLIGVGLEHHNEGIGTLPMTRDRWLASGLSVLSPSLTELRRRSSMLVSTNGSRPAGQVREYS